MLKQKIALGTVQLGLAYGINNKTGKPDKQEAFGILDKALETGINVLDSAEAYGDSLQVIGNYLNDHPTVQFDIISKFIENGSSILEKFEETVKALNGKHPYSYMYHRFSDYQKGKSKSALLQLKADGRINKIGVSVYGIDELRLVINDNQIDLIQIPHNPFDSSKEKNELLLVAKSNGKEIHVRSVFLQGLFFKKPSELTGNLVELSEPLRAFYEITTSYNLTVTQACINYALHNSLIDKVIIGIERRAQLEQNLAAVLEDFPMEVNERLEALQITDESLLNPSNWKP